LFADDTAISLKAGNEEDLRLSLETVALNVNYWFHENQLIPNLEKLIDSTFLFKVYISKLVATLSRSLRCLHRIKFLFPYQIVRTFYFSLVECYFQYCPSVWILTFPSHLDDSKLSKINQKESWTIFGHTKNDYLKKDYLKLKYLFYFWVFLICNKFSP